MGFDTSGLLPLSDALQGMLDQLACCCDTEQVPLPHALGRVIAGDIASPLSVPPFDNAAMDGYAVRLLLAKGADPDRNDNSGRSARDYMELMSGNSLLKQEFANADAKRAESGTKKNYGPSF